MQQEMIEHALGKGVEHNAEAALVATSTVSAVRLLLRELQPLVGELAACALYKRSVHLARSSLRRCPDDAPTHEELLALLHEDLSARAVAEAQKGSRALLNAFVDLLVSLIGDSLTHRLLTKAWGVRAHARAPVEKPE
jgi:hypothetical protein